MSFDGFDDEFCWNEHQWEAHLNELEKRSEQLRKFITADPKGSTPRWLTLLRENIDEHETVDAFIEEELLLDEAYFPEDEDDWDEEDDFDDDDLFRLDDAFPNAEENDFDEGDEWKYLSDDYIHSEFGSIESFELYNRTRRFAVDVLKWAETVQERHHNKTYHEFVSEVLKIGAKIAGGYSFGFERDFLGGNIAYNKKALYCANNALKLLLRQRKYPYFEKNTYQGFHNRLFELRNDIGIYIQELRDQFNYGID